MRNPWRTSFLVLATVMATLVVQVALGATFNANKGAKRAAVATGVSATTTSSTYSIIPGAEVQIRVPANQTALFIARFTGESSCNFGAAGKACHVSFSAVPPGGGGTIGFCGGRLVFDTDDTGDNYYESHSKECWLAGGLAGMWTFRAQFAVDGGSTTRFDLSHWVFVVEEWRMT